MSEDLFARENDLLGGAFTTTAGGTGTAPDEFDLDRAASAFPDIDIDGDIPAHLAGGTNNASGFGLTLENLTSPSAPDVKITGEDEFDKFESAFPSIETLPQPVFSPPPPQRSLSANTPAFAPRPQPSAGISTPILQASLENEDEPGVIKKWREEEAETIRKRDELSEQKKKETIAKAQRSIDEFYDEYNAKKEKQIKENKVSEAEYLASLKDLLSSGTTWTRICDLIELDNSQSKTIARTGTGTADLSRFREILLRLKREGPTAPGAAGY